MLHSFAIANGKVSYRNKFIESNNLKMDRAAGKIVVPEFGTDPCKNLFGRVASLFQKTPEFQNTNVNVAKIMGRHVALTESTPIMEFDVDTLNTIGSVKG